MKHIRILSPASAIDPQWIEKASLRLKEWGVEVSVSTHARGNCGRFSSLDEDRIADLNEAFADDSIDMILCARGGYGLQRILDKIVLPNRSITRWPMVVGFSDITALHSLMSVHGVVSLHANMCKDISLLPDDDEALVAERAWLTGGDTLLTVECESDLCRNGIAEGKIIGGNLSVLYGLQGTPYDLNTIIDKCDEPPLLFIEDICEKHYHIDRMLQNLRMSGVLNRIAGLVVGQFTDCDDDDTMGCTLLESIRQIVEPYKFPVLFNYPSGHIDSNMPLCFMRKYRLEVQDNKGSLTIL